MIKGISFLLIDDDEDDREFFQLALEDIDKEIEYSGIDSGRKALSVLKQQEPLPDYIFLDLNMPGMSGRECLTELKKDTALKHIPVIIFSTSSDPRDIEETKKLGAIDFITKPSKISDLRNALTTFITKHVSQII